MEIYRIFAAAVLFISVCLIQCRQNFLQEIPEDGSLNFTALGNKYGHSVEEYDVVTEDGYILKLFHIPGNRNQPVLLQHGILDSADTFIIRGEGSLAITLANEGYDVWAGNSRGNRYSRRHISLDPDVDKKYWDYSFHEAGYYDLPAMIDYILDKSGQKTLSAIGHSQGNMIFYVLGSTRPEYNVKINVMIALSPVCFLNYPKPAIKTLIILTPVFDSVLRSLGQEEIFNDKSTFKLVSEAVCAQKNLGYAICAHGVLFVIGGSDPEEFEMDFLPVVAAHYPSGASRKNVVHVRQIAINKIFAQFDYGSARNLEIYNTLYPTKYDLDKVAMRIALLFGDNDTIVSLKDLALLHKSLPNVVEYRKIEHKKFSHLDAVWGRNMKIYLFPHIFEILRKYNTLA